MKKRTIHPEKWIVLLIVIIILDGLNPIPTKANDWGNIRLPATQPQQTEPTPEVPSDWLTTIQEDLQQAEYNITWQEQTYLSDLPAAYQSPNRANNLRAYYAPQGLIVIPRIWVEVIETPPWRIEISLTTWGRAGALSPVPEASLEATKSEDATNRIDFLRDSIVEWYRNDENGIEQGFTLSSPPVEGEGPLQLELILSGTLYPQMNSSGDGIEFMNDEGQAELHYGGLAAVDAEGKSLPAWMTLDDATLSLIIDDSGAVYPIEIDPILTGLPSDDDWNYGFVTANTKFGFSVATAGDVNGDGYSDVIIGAPNFDGGMVDNGMAVVVDGSANGLEASAGWVIIGDQANANFGYSVSTAGDTNDDGYAEVIIGTPYHDADYIDDGAAWVYYGASSGLPADPGEYYHAGADDYGAFGISVAFAGDVNGDGYADVIVGADRYDHESDDEGAAFVWYGSEEGVNEGVTGTPANADWSAEINSSGARFGAAVSTAGDVNGDGYADVIVGAPYYGSGEDDEGAARLYLGSETGLETGYDNHDEGNKNDAQFGKSVGTAGDVNGDGYADVIVGAPYYTNDSSEEGMAFVWYGSAGGISTSRDWDAEGDAVNANYGYSVATAGDVNGDGYSDIIVGAPGKNTSGGSAFAYYGSSDSVEDDYGWNKPSNKENAHFGHAVASAGDVNGDGYADVIVGGPQWDGGLAFEGIATLYLGSGSGLNIAPSWSKTSNQENAQYGWSVSTAGDVNGDGYDDVIVGAPYYDHSQENEGMVWVYHGNLEDLDSAPSWDKESDQANAHFGYDVSTAGDVNGDGYSDVIVGAPDIDMGQSDEGAAWVYKGSADGLISKPIWYAQSDQADAAFGYSVSTAGDINADGYFDVIIGAPEWNNGQNSEGGAWVFVGSHYGLNESFKWRQDSDQIGANYGYSVGTAGDVNGDGCSDIIVGAPRYERTAEYENEGKAYVYLSTGSSLSYSPIFEKPSNQAGASFGCSVGTAGDVNGDGYADIIVGAYLWNAGETNEGGAWVYHGSSSGVISAPQWYAQGNQTTAHFGSSVASAGDVNGDGYADVVVGAPWYEESYNQEGEAFVYHGNGGEGLSLGMFNYNSEGVRVAHLGKLDTDQFRLSTTNRNPFGRGDSAFEIETKPLRTGFDGENTWVPGGQWNNPELGIGTSMISSQISSCNPFHWRLRVLYRPSTTPFMPASRWMTIPWNGWNEMDLRPSGMCVSLPIILRDD